ncbi:integrase core domain-containing protein [Providencia rettgeri]|nr:integrase core domain-containing protein [Providencia rettgeri]
MKTSSVKKSLVKALKKRCLTTSLIYHSDRGVQYCSAEYLLIKPSNLEQVRKLIEESIQLYNEKRPHLPLNYKMPDEVHRAFYLWL